MTIMLSNNIIITNNKCIGNCIDGIMHEQSNNNLFSNNTCSMNSIHGILISFSNNNMIIGNNCSYNGDSGMTIAGSNKNVIENNSCAKNANGIFLSSSRSDILKNNLLFDNGINMMNNNPVDNTNTHTITSDNKVNGKPIEYIKNQTGGTIKHGAGQIILANCNGVIINNQNLSNCSMGISLLFSNNCIINANNCSFNANYYGIYISYSNGNILTNNSCFYNNVGCYIESSYNNKFKNNSYYNNFNGIQSRESAQNKFFYNYYFFNSIGIEFDNSECNIIYYNRFIQNNNPSGKQAYDSNGMNFWNTSTTGNYWSDWAFPDSNHDGIVDFPYIIDGCAGTKDYFPIADWTPPKVEITSPKDGYPANGNVSVVIEASDNCYLKFVNLSINGTIVVSNHNAFTYLWDTNSVANGLINLSADAMDYSNNHAWSNITINVFNSVHTPICNIIYPSNGDILNGTVMITGNASDPAGDLTIAYVHVGIDSSGWRSATGTTSWYYLWNTSGLVQGYHTIIAQAFDINGTCSIPVVVNVIVNNTLNNTDKIGWIEGFITSDNTSAISGVNVSVEPPGYYAFTDLIGHYNITAIAGCSYKVQANVQNHLTSQVSGISVTDGKTTYLDFVLQYNGPNIIKCTIASPSNGDIVNGIVNISGISFSRLSTIAFVEVEIGSGLWNNATGTLSWSYSWDTLKMINCSYTIKARASDGVAYSTEFSIVVNVNNTVKYTGNITISVENSISKSGIISANLSIPILGLVKLTDNSGFCNFTNIPPGNYDITASKTGYENSTCSATVNISETTRIHFYLIPLSNIETKIMGKVIDNSTSNPIGNVMIRIGNYTTKSNPTGKYLLKLPTGNYMLNVTKDGYKPYERNIHVDIGNNTIDIRLEPIELKKAPPDFTFFIVYKV